MTKNQQMMQQEKITKTLTDKEKLFAELAAENFYASETKPNYQLAIEAGYAEKSARQRAYENLNPRIKPNVVIYIEELKEDLRTLHNKVDMSIYATTGFLATTLVAILLVSI